jgi:hypothetical protein
MHSAGKALKKNHLKYKPLICFFRKEIFTYIIIINTILLLLFIKIS